MLKTRTAGGWGRSQALAEYPETLQLLRKRASIYSTGEPQPATDQDKQPQIESDIPASSMLGSGSSSLPAGFADGVKLKLTGILDEVGWSEPV